ncbi:MAG: hypothetical protein Ct9H90mP19_0600 [Gammaproteobacteria bacterium]|nr:MAG: hypothetical protein Ct9H90mP19_0600 [Gammaproteobacteria bacterium]
MIKGFCPSFITVDAQLKSDTVFREIGDLPDPERNINNEISNIMLTGIGDWRSNDFSYIGLCSAF